jgi:hypothetical protein
MTIYLDLTREFNRGRLRAVICSGQAVVLHRLAVTSKDGDWILREDEEALRHVLHVLDRHGARYRFGAPLDLHWMRGGWSSHLEFRTDTLRVRTDFFTRPPRVTPAELARVWQEQEGRDPPFVDARTLADMKKTNREKDYAVIGELARLLSDPRDQLLYSRSARDLIELSRANPALATELAAQRPLLSRASSGREALEEALDVERRAAMRVNEERLDAYREAARAFEKAWPALSTRMERTPLLESHELLVEAATRLLPQQVQPSQPR